MNEVAQMVEYRVTTVWAINDTEDAIAMATAVAIGEVRDAFDGPWTLTSVNTFAAWHGGRLQMVVGVTVTGRKDAQDYVFRRRT